MLNLFGAGATKCTTKLLATALLSFLTMPAQAAVILQGHILQNAPLQIEQLNRWLPEPGFDGIWSAETRVLESSCQSVPIGSTVTSYVRFCRTREGALQAGWEQPGWIVSNQQFQSISATEASMDRSNVALGENLGCTEESHDYYRQIAQDKMIVSSYIDIFEGGQYVGRYETESMLTRVAPAVVPTMCRGELSKEKDNGLYVPTH